MIQTLVLIYRLAGDVDAELTIYTDIDLREHDTRMCLGTGELRDLLKDELRYGICCGANRQCDEHFIGVQPWVFVAEIADLQLLYRFDDHR